MFRHGCPQCGYGSSPSAKPNGTPADSPRKKERRKIQFPKFNQGFILPEEQKRKVPIGSLPIWVYIVVLFLVLGILLLAEAVL